MEWLLWYSQIQICDSSASSVPGKSPRAPSARLVPAVTSSRTSTRVWRTLYLPAILQLLEEVKAKLHVTAVHTDVALEGSGLRRRLLWRRCTSPLCTVNTIEAFSQAADIRGSEPISLYPVHRSCIPLGDKAVAPLAQSLPSSEGRAT
jgi:hypothetical protein